MSRLSWGASIGVAFLMLPIGLVAAGVLAERWARWYHWSTAEGAAGYAVILWALIGGILSFAVGLVAARMLGPAGSPFLRALGVSAGIVLGSVAILGAAGRALADVPPEIGGEELMLHVEVRWPPSRRERPELPTGTAVVRLGRQGAVGDAMLSDGIIWIEDARLEEGRWVAPGAVPITTGRGSRLLEVVLDDLRESETSRRFGIPLGGSPGMADTAWSPWIPRALEGAPASDEEIEVRYRVQPESAVVRTERVGPFAVDVIVRGFGLQSRGGTSPVLTPDARFVVRLDGSPLAIAWSDENAARSGARGLSEITAVAEIAGPRPALLVAGGGGIGFVVEEDGRVRQGFVATGAPWDLSAHPATNDGAIFAQATRIARRGRVDRELLATPGPYVVGGSLFDTRTLDVHRLPDTDPMAVAWEAVPVAISPDGRSVVRFAERDLLTTPDDGSDPEQARYDAEGVMSRPLLAVVDVVAGRTYGLPIDRARMRYSRPEQLDPAWVAHHFEWVRGEGVVDRLVERGSFTPLPHRGHVKEEGPGQVAYLLAPAHESLLEAIIDLLVKEMSAERVPMTSAMVWPQLRIDGQTLEIFHNESERVVQLFTGLERRDGAIVRRVAAHIDSVLATGRLDEHFGR